jgi:hypothetical protein
MAQLSMTSRVGPKLQWSSHKFVCEAVTRLIINNKHFLVAAAAAATDDDGDGDVVVFVSVFVLNSNATNHSIHG